VQPHGAASAFRAPVPNRVGHVDKADSPAVFAMACFVEAALVGRFRPSGVRSLARQALPSVVVDGAQQHRPAKQIWAIEGVDIPDADRSPGSVNF
jgi:hypothetical protein